MVAKNIERILTEAEALESSLSTPKGGLEGNHELLVVRACATQLRSLAEKANHFAMEMTLRTMRYQHAQLWGMQQHELDSNGTPGRWNGVGGDIGSEHAEEDGSRGEGDVESREQSDSGGGWRSVVC